jgi:hypothetical protein
MYGGMGRGNLDTGSRPPGIERPAWRPESYWIDSLVSAL